MTTPHRTLLQQALDALTNCLSEHGHRCNRCDSEIDEGGKLIAALREALAAPEPEPVAEVYRARYGRRARNVGVDDVRKLNGVALPPLGTKLYAAPPAAPDHLRDVAEKAAPAAPVPDGWVMVPRGLLRRLIAEALTFDPSLQDKEAIEQAKQLAASPAAPVPDALVEAVAKAIYWEWRRDAGYVPWVDGGNSLKQDDARKIARAVVSSAAPVVREPRHVRKVGGSFQHTGAVVAEFKTTAGEPRIVLEFDAPVAGMLHVYRPDQVEPCEPAAPAATSASPAVPLTDDLIDSVIRDVAELDYSSPEGMPDVMLVTADELRGILQAHGITGGSNAT